MTFKYKNPWNKALSNSRFMISFPIKYQIGWQWQKENLYNETRSTLPGAPPFFIQNKICSNFIWKNNRTIVQFIFFHYFSYQNEASGAWHMLDARARLVVRLYLGHPSISEDKSDQLYSPPFSGPIRELLLFAPRIEGFGWDISHFGGIIHTNIK